MLVLSWIDTTFCLPVVVMLLASVPNACGMPALFQRHAGIR
jgi:hypothetical protein